MLCFLGYAVGAVIGGFLYRYVGGRGALQIFSAMAVICGIMHLILHKTLLRHHEVPEIMNKQIYKAPAEAAQTVMKNSE